jgi:REP element-mobilizing transposase RayT
LTEVGEVVNKYWLNIPMHFENMKIDAHIVMPNHIHGIIIIHDKADVVGVQNSKPLRHKANLVGVQHPELPQHKANLVGVQNFEPLQHKFQKVIPKSIGSAIRAFKAAVTNWCRNSGITNFRWQRNFHDRIIRSDSELNRIRTYIAQNPFLWEDDVENPRNASHIAACEQYYGKIFGSGV